MFVSTKGRYALRVLVDMAEHLSDGYIPLWEIAERQEISAKYLEIILKQLVNGGLVTGMRGKGGGYRLSKRPEQYTAGEILRCAEGNLAPVACLKGDHNTCSRMAECRTLPMWEKLDRLINDYLDGITLADLMSSDQDGGDYVI